MSYETGQILNYFLYSIPFWIPAAIGLYLIVRRPGDLGLMAGLFTLKPIVTTPIWFTIVRNLYGGDPFKPAHFLSILPGASLTLILVLMFRHLFSGPGSRSARLLLMLDCARWLNSFLIIFPYGRLELGALGCIFIIIGLTLPTIFAFVALTQSLTQAQETFR